MHLFYSEDIRTHATLKMTNKALYTSFERHKEGQQNKYLNGKKAMYAHVQITKIDKHEVQCKLLLVGLKKFHHNIAICPPLRIMHVWNGSWKRQK